MDALLQSLATTGELTLQDISLRLILAMMFGVAVAIVYRIGHGRTQDETWVLTTTLVLLAVLIAMVSMVIGDSVARAFGLVGALSIVRFRTVVDDTRDTAFVMFAVIVGMAAGTGLLLAPLVGIPVVGTVALVMNRFSRSAGVVPGTQATIEVRQSLGELVPSNIVTVLKKFTTLIRIERTSTSKQGAALDVVYSVRLIGGELLLPLVSELNRTEGVQAVDGKVSRSEERM
jgi:hypothetical protein